MKNLSEYLPIIVSIGTLRNQDLLPAFLSAVSEYAPAIYSQLSANLWPFIPSYATDDDDADFWDSEDAAFKLHELHCILDENAPAGYYFGTSEGDGAEFGFFPVFEPVTGNVFSGHFLARMADSECIAVVRFSDMTHEDRSDMRLPQMSGDEYDSILIAITTERQGGYAEGLKDGIQEGMKYGEHRATVRMKEEQEKTEVCPGCGNMEKPGDLTYENEDGDYICLDCHESNAENSYNNLSEPI